MTSEIQYLTEQEVSTITRRALSTLRNDRFHRRGISYRKIVKSVGYLRSDVLAFMESRIIEAIPLQGKQINSERRDGNTTSKRQRNDW